MRKKFLEDIAVVLCKKRLEKTANIRKMRAFWKWPKNGHQAKAIRLSKIVTLGQNLKMHKNMRKKFLEDIAVVLCKKRLEKTANIRKMRAFWKWPKMATKQRL